MTIQFQSSVLFVRDIQTSRRFYEELLGQEVEMDFGANVGYKGGFAIWQVDSAFEVIFERPADAEAPLGRDNLELYFESPDLDIAWTRLSSQEVEVVHPLREQPWGQRVIRIFDPDGHIVEIGEPMPIVIARYLAQGMKAEAVAERTLMPLEFIQQVAESTTTNLE
jgi:catechol 2,3-dioxygenase-like lactoylglutathione lyase family enzyme